MNSSYSSNLPGAKQLAWQGIDYTLFPKQQRRLLRSPMTYQNFFNFNIQNNRENMHGEKGKWQCYRLSCVKLGPRHHLTIFFLYFPLHLKKQCCRAHNNSCRGASKEYILVIERTAPRCVFQTCVSPNLFLLCLVNIEYTTPTT